MRICDLQQKDVHIGMYIRSLDNYNKIGEIISINEFDDDWTVVEWRDGTGNTSGFYGTNCQCEVVDSRS